MAPHGESHILSLWFESEQVKKHRSHRCSTQHSINTVICFAVGSWLCMYATSLQLSCDISKTQLCKQAIKKGSEQHGEDFFWSAYVD